MNKVRIIAVGSRNPVKIGAVKDGLGRVFPRARYIGVEVDSGVEVQPMTDEQTMQGARNRARRALDKSGADVAVGLEGGVIKTSEGMMNTVWCCILTKEGVESLSGGNHLELPRQVALRIDKGKELSEVMDEILKAENTGRKQGMIGALTGGVTSRREAYAHLVKLATVKFMNPKLYSQ